MRGTRSLPLAVALASFPLLSGAAHAGAPVAREPTPISIEVNASASAGNQLAIDGVAIDLHTAVGVEFERHIQWLRIGFGLEGQPIAKLAGAPWQGHGALLLGTEQPVDRFDVQLLGELGIHHFGNLGDSGLFQDYVSGPRNADLPYAGARIGITTTALTSSRAFVGLWLMARQDLEERQVDVQVAGFCFPFCRMRPMRIEHYDLGGTELGLSLRTGLKF